MVTITTHHLLLIVGTLFTILWAASLSLSRLTSTPSARKSHLELSMIWLLAGIIDWSLFVVTA